MLEIEMKFAVRDLREVERRLTEWEASRRGPHDEADHYFNAPDRDFAQTDEAFRIRRIGDKNLITYKGPKINAVVKTRNEIEVPLGDGSDVADQFARLLVLLGYRPVAVVRKLRRPFGLMRGGFQMEVCLDEVSGVGTFVELEICAPEERMEAAQAVVRETAAALSLTLPEHRSYLRMLLENTSTGSKA